MTQPAPLFPPGTAHKSDPQYPIVDTAAVWWFGDDGASLHAMQIQGEAVCGRPEACNFVLTWTQFMRSPDSTKFEEAKAAFAAWKQRAMS